MAAMKTSPGLVNFFIYNSTFGPKEGMVCDFILNTGLFCLQYVRTTSLIEAANQNSSSYGIMCMQQ